MLSLRWFKQLSLARVITPRIRPPTLDDVIPQQFAAADVSHASLELLQIQGQLSNLQFPSAVEKTSRNTRSRATVQRTRPTHSTSYIVMWYPYLMTRLATPHKGCRVLPWLAACLESFSMRLERFGKLRGLSLRMIRYEHGYCNAVGLCLLFPTVSAPKGTFPYVRAFWDDARALAAQFAPNYSYLDDTTSSANLRLIS